LGGGEERREASGAISAKPLPKDATAKCQAAQESKLLFFPKLSRCQNNFVDIAVNLTPAKFSLYQTLKKWLESKTLKFLRLAPSRS